MPRGNPATTKLRWPWTDSTSLAQMRDYEGDVLPLELREAV